MGPFIQLPGTSTKCKSSAPLQVCRTGLLWGKYVIIDMAAVIAGERCIIVFLLRSLTDMNLPSPPDNIPAERFF